MNLALVQEAPPLRTDETGTVRVGKSRVTLDVLISAFQNGASPESIAEDFDTLDLADVYGAISYYLKHQTTVDAYLDARRQAAAARQLETESKPDYKLWRDRLIARAKQQRLRT